MRIAFMTDLHANWLRSRPAWTMRARSTWTAWSSWGDYIGYGPEPNEVVERVMREVEHGAIAVLGNHDSGPRRDQ